MMLEAVQCNWCETIYEDIDIKECEDCKTDGYLMDINVSGSKYNRTLKKEE